MKKQKKEENSESKEKNFIKKPFLLGFIGTAFLFLAPALVLLFSLINSWEITLFVIVLLFISYLLVLSSFYYLGKKYSSKLIMILSVIIGVFSIIMIFSLVFTSIITFQKISSNEKAMEAFLKIQNKKVESLTREQEDLLLFYLKPLILYIIGFYLIYAILQTILSIGLFGLKEVKYSQAFSILNIVTAVNWFLLILIEVYFLLPLYIALVVIQGLMFYELAKQNKEI